jgi:cytochrome c oxidase subunit 2
MRERNFMKKRLILPAAIAVLAIAAILIGNSTLAENTPRRIEVTATKFTFTPGEITLKKGEPVVLVLKSVDVAHGLRFRELNLNVKVDKSHPAEMSFTPEKTGDFVGHCSVFCGSGHGGMALTLHVVE